MLTSLLRRNMMQFAHFPQAWVLNMLSSVGGTQEFPGRASSQEGHLVCGMYRVKHRAQSKVEIELKPTGTVNERLVVSIEERGDDVVFTTETVMRKPAKEKTLLPVGKGPCQMGA